jgi:hypothetical protein
MANTMKASNGGLFIQYKPGGEPLYIGCVDVDAITAPKGDSTPINCHGDGEGEFVTMARRMPHPAT